MAPEIIRAAAPHFSVLPIQRPASFPSEHECQCLFLMSMNLVSSKNSHIDIQARPNIFLLQVFADVTLTTVVLT